MSEASRAGRPAPQEFEKVLSAATTALASFEEERLTFLQRLQRFLHLYPTTVPFVVLLLGPAARRDRQSARFVTGSNIFDRADPGDDHRHPRHRPDPGHPDRRHRSLGRRHHGHFLGRDGATGGLRRRAGHSRLSARPALRRRLRLAQRHAGDAAADAAVHRHPRHAQHHRRAAHLLFAERDHRHAGHRRKRAVSATDGRSLPDRRRAHHLGHFPVGPAGASSSGTFSIAPPTAATSMRRATIRRPRGSPASTPTRSCSASMFSRGSSRRSPAGR